MLMRAERGWAVGPARIILNRTLPYRTVLSDARESFTTFLCSLPPTRVRHLIDSLDVSRKSKNRFESMLLGTKIYTIMIRTW